MSRTDTPAPADVAPEARARAAAAAFLRPRRAAGEPGAGLEFVPAARSGAPLNHWVRGTGPTVLLVHGWDGSPADLAPFVEPLVQRGLRAVAIELPAHGRSAADWTSVPHAAEALAAFGRHVGAVQAVIGHSVGGAVSALALSQGLQASVAVLIAAPDAYIDYVRAFASALALGEKDLDALVAALRRDWQVDPWAVSTARTAVGLDLPALVVHSGDDQVVPVADARRIHQAWTDSTLLEVTGLGHRRLLADPMVLQRALDFIGTRLEAQR